MVKQYYHLSHNVKLLLFNDTDLDISIALVSTANYHQARRLTVYTSEHYIKHSASL